MLTIQEKIKTVRQQGEAKVSKAESELKVALSPLLHTLNALKRKECMKLSSCQGPRIVFGNSKELKLWYCPTFHLHKVADVVNSGFCVSPYCQAWYSQYFPKPNPSPDLSEDSDMDNNEIDQNYSSSKLEEWFDNNQYFSYYSTIGVDGDGTVNMYYYTGEDYFLKGLGINPLYVVDSCVDESADKFLDRWGPKYHIHVKNGIGKFSHWSREDGYIEMTHFHSVRCSNMIHFLIPQGLK